jgi:hypothetical protein
MCIFLEKSFMHCRKKPGCLRPVSRTVQRGYILLKVKKVLLRLPKEQRVVSKLKKFISSTRVSKWRVKNFGLKFLN